MSELDVGERPGTVQLSQLVELRYRVDRLVVTDGGGEAVLDRGSQLVERRLLLAGEDDRVLVLHRVDGLPAELRSCFGTATERELDEPVHREPGTLQLDGGDLA
nr:hypothetical protein [Pseudonocardia humida]